MILLALKIPFLIGAFWFWFISDDEKMSAAIWALTSFIIKFAILGFTTSLPVYGIVAFVVAWGVFYGLSFLQQTIWLWPASIIGIAAMLIVS